MSFIRSKEIPPGSGNFYDYEVMTVHSGGKVTQKHMVQTQTLGITFEPNHKEIVTYCPKCGHQNTAIYWRYQEEYMAKHGASVVCCDCGIPYPVKLETKDDLLARCDEGRQAREMF